MIYFPNFLLLATDYVISLSKKEYAASEKAGDKLNTWTFTIGQEVYSGPLLFEGAFLNRSLQINNTYLFSMMGVENTSGYTFSLLLNLNDLHFKQKNYEAGYRDSNYQNAFCYSPSPLIETIGQSSFSAGSHSMRFNIACYEAEKDIVTILFSGETNLPGGEIIIISGGKATAAVNRFGETSLIANKS